jgi:hypothetical protein
VDAETAEDDTMTELAREPVETLIEVDSRRGKTLPLAEHEPFRTRVEAEDTIMLIPTVGIATLEARMLQSPPIMEAIIRAAEARYLGSRSDRRKRIR